MSAKKEFNFKKCNETFLYYRIKKEGMIENITSKNKELVKNQLKNKHENFYLGG